jgi:hypothetical protein
VKLIGHRFKNSILFQTIEDVRTEERKICITMDEFQGREDLMAEEG